VSAARRLVAPVDVKAGLRVPLRHGGADHRHAAGGSSDHDDIAERVLPARGWLAVPERSRADASRQLMPSRRWRSAWPPARLRDNTGSSGVVPRRGAELVAEGVVGARRGEGWRQQAYRHVDARTRSGAGTGAAVPVDPLIWERGTAPERLFDFFYRHRDHVPEPNAGARYTCSRSCWARPRRRVDIKADRAEGVRGCPGRSPSSGWTTRRVAHALAEELRLMADWIGLDGVVVGKRGDLASRLGAVV